MQEIKEVPDDYDQKAEYGLYTGDSENARNHLLGILKLAYRNKELVERWKSEARRDLSNWFSCINIFEYDSVVQEVLRVMVYIGYGEVVRDRIEKEYQSYESHRKDFLYDEIWKPAYIELYMELGDYCLFSMGNDVLAMGFYHLAASDWQEVRLLYVYSQIHNDFLHTPKITASNIKYQ